MRILIFILCLFFVVPVSAQEEAAPNNLTIDMASDHIDITTGFNGTTMELFGVRRNNSDIAVIVRGPERTMTVWRKDNVVGAWINSSFENFKRVPSYYNYALSAPLESLAPIEVLKNYGIGPQYLQFNKNDPNDKNRQSFREAMIRNKEKQGLYVDKPGEIVFLSPDFFRANFYVPANVPVGEYEIQTITFVGGNVQDVQTKKVRVAQVGTSARIHQFAHDNSLMYGLLCVALAIFAGWFSNRVRRG